MEFWGRIQSAYKAFSGPNQEELLKDSQDFKRKVSNESPLQESIKNLLIKVEKSKSREERYILEKQLKKLEKINTLYKKNLEDFFTKNTRKEIILLLKWLEIQINSKENNIKDDYISLRKIIRDEKNKLEDTINIVWKNTLRDRIESSINIIWVQESITPKKYQEFFDLATTTYIDLIEDIRSKDTLTKYPWQEDKKNIKINEKELRKLVQNKWLYLNKSELHTFISNLLKNINDKLTINLDFDFTIKLKKWNYRDLVLINLEKINTTIHVEKVDEEKVEVYEEKVEEKTDEEKEKNRIKNIINSEEFKNNMEKYSSEIRMKYLTKLISSEEFKPYLWAIINKIEWKTVYFPNNEKVILSKDFIELNSEKILKNLKDLFLIIVEIESDWNPKIQNQISSAQWLWQWLTKNGRKDTEYMYDFKWHSEQIKWRQYTKKRKILLTSSFETALKRIKNHYSDELLINLDFIPKNFDKPINLRPIDLTAKQQLKILILDLWANQRETNNNKTIRTYFSTAVLWNKWAIKEMYKIFHHTNPDKETLERINKVFSKYDLYQL